MSSFNHSINNEIIHQSQISSIQDPNIIDNNEIEEKIVNEDYKYEIFNQLKRIEIDIPQTELNNVSSSIESNEDNEIKIKEFLDDSQKLPFNKNINTRRVSKLFRMEKNQKPTKVVDLCEIANLLKKSENHSIFTLYTKRKYITDMIIFIVVVANIVFSIIDNEVYIALSDVFISDYMIENDIKALSIEILKYIENRVLTTTENLIRIFNMLCSFVLTILLIYRYKLEVVLMKADGKLMKYDNIFSSGLYKQLTFEIMICGSFFPPFLNIVISGSMLGSLYVYNINSIISIIVFSKLYVLGRILTYLSRWNTESAIAICNKYKVKSGLQLAMKAEMDKRPALILTILFVISLILLGFSTRTFEYGIISPTSRNLKGNSELNFISNCFWLIIVTMTTVGYGDYYPRSQMGRLIGVIACLIGMILLSLVVVSLGVITKFTTEENKAYLKLKYQIAHEDVEYRAANIIKIIIYLNRLNKIKRDKSLASERFLCFNALKKEIYYFRHNTIQANSYTFNLDDMLKKAETKISEDITQLNSNIQKFYNIDKDIESIEKEMNKQEKRLERILHMQSCLHNYLINVNNPIFKNSTNKTNSMSSSKSIELRSSNSSKSVNSSILN